MSPTAAEDRAPRCCAAPAPELAFPAARGPAARWPLVLCARCALVYVRDPRSIEELDQAQQNAYGAPTQRFGAVLEGAVRAFRAARARLVQRLVPRGARILDVGCGRGLFLRLLRERGFEVRGTELSEATRRNAYADVPIDAGELTAASYPPGSFDLISIWHVLEHVRDPHATLDAAHQALAPNGVLLLAVPNFASWQARFGGERWFHLDLPRHLWQFTPTTLRALLTQHGFHVERLRTGQWEMDPYGWVQTLLNRAGFRHNALYDTLRSNPADKADLSLPYRTLQLLLFPLLLPAAFALASLARAVGRAGTVIAVARRRSRSEAE